MLVSTATLVAGGLLLTGVARIGAIAALGILVPVVALTAACATRRRLRSRIEGLQTEVTTERTARLATQRLYTPLADDLRSPTAIRVIETVTIAAQIDSGSYRPSPAVVHLDRLLAKTLDGCDHAPIRVDLDVQTVPAWCDPAAIHQALFNVLRTAVIDGAIEAAITVEERNGLAVLTITDNRTTEGDLAPNPLGLLATGDELARHIVPALIEYQGGTVRTTRTGQHTSTMIQVPLATPAQLAADAAVPTPLETTLAAF